MILILRQPHSGFASALVRNLQDNRRETVVLDPHQAATGVGLSFRLGSNGTSLEFVIGSRSIADSEIEAVYAEFGGFDPESWPFMSRKDAEYAVAETTALWIALLSSLECPMINPPGRNMMAGGLLFGGELYDVAAEAGLRTPTVAVLESGKVAAELVAMGTAASYWDLGNPEEPERALDARALTAYPTYLTQVRVKEIETRGRLSLIVIDSHFFGAAVWEDGTARSVPDGELEELATAVAAIQAALHLVMAQYVFAFDGRHWVLDHMARCPSASWQARHGSGPVDAAARYLTKGHT